MTPENEAKPEKKGSLKQHLIKAGLFFLELTKVVVLAAVTIVLIRHFLFKPFYVRGASMQPSFDNGEYLIIDELSYRFRAPERGEVIVFKFPKENKEFFLKRIVGLPGERVKITDGRILIYNEEHPEGLFLQESYVKDDRLIMGDRTVALGEEEYFVLGDNRGNSYDSRRFGAISKDLVVGRAFFRGWPFDKAQLISTPEFGF